MTGRRYPPELASLPESRRRALLDEAEREVQQGSHSLQAAFMLLLVGGMVLSVPAAWLFSQSRLNPGLPFEAVFIAALLASLVGTPAVMNLVARRFLVRPWLRRRLRHLCDGCGYNLTGNTSGTCPECGRGIPGRGREV